MSGEHNRRRAAPSRGSCLTCRKRRLRCPKNKPICQRCWNDNKQCSYAQPFQWERSGDTRAVNHQPTESHINHQGARSKDSTQASGHFINFQASSSTILLPSQSLWSISYPARVTPGSIPGANELYAYYCGQVCQSMTLIDGPSNAFRQIILPIALQNPIVLNMIFAVGALSLALSGRSELYPVALRFKIRSIQLLRCEISSDESAVNDHNLMVILLLCIFEASDSPDISWSIHFCAAFDMLQANVRKGMGKFTPEVLNFVSQFFRLKEALGGTACGKRSKVNKFPMINDAQISPLLGCSFELIDIISTITDMSAKAQSLQIQSEQLSEADLLRHRLENLRQALPSDTPLKELQAPNGVTNTGNNGLDILHKTSLLMHLATKLYLLTSFRFVGARSSCVRDLVSEAIAIVASLSPSFLHPAHLWPMFVCAVYAESDQDRLFFLEGLRILESHDHIHLAARSLQKARKIVEISWKIFDDKQRDGNCSVYYLDNILWDGWVDDLQPMIRGLCII